MRRDQHHIHHMTATEQKPMSHHIKPGDSTVLDWIEWELARPTDECLIWPFAIIPNGYGTMQIRKVSHYAHRYVCEKVHGPCPDGQEAAHACGVRACVNPRHLSWKTRSENQLDRRKHGTINRPGFGQRGKLTTDQKHYIKLLKGKATQRELAALFGVTFQNISYIQRRFR